MMAGDAAGVNFMTATPQRLFEFLAYFGIGTRLQIRLRIDCELLLKVRKLEFFRGKSCARRG